MKFSYLVITFHLIYILIYAVVIKIIAHYNYNNSNCLAPTGRITAVARHPRGLCHLIWMRAYTCENVKSVNTYHPNETFLSFQKRFGWTGARTNKQSHLLPHSLCIWICGLKFHFQKACFSKNKSYFVLKRKVVTLHFKSET